MSTRVISDRSNNVSTKTAQSITCSFQLFSDSVAKLGPNICGDFLATPQSTGLVTYLCSHNIRIINEELDKFDRANREKQEKQNAARQIELPSKRTRLESMMKSSGTSSVKEDLKESSAMCFAVHDLSIRLASSPYFHTMLEDYHKARRMQLITKFPTPRTVAAQQRATAKHLNESVLSMLSSSSRDAPVTLAFDGWCNVNRVHIQNILALCHGSSYFLKSDASADGRATAAVLFAQIKPVLDRLITAKVTVAAIVADNASVNGAIGRLIVSEYNWILTLPCAADTLQLCVLRLFDQGAIAESLKSVVKRIYSKIANSVVLNQSFETIQKESGGSAHRLHKPHVLDGALISSHSAAFLSPKLQSGIFSGMKESLMNLLMFSGLT